MPNLTITVDDEVLRRARIRALEQGTSVNQLLRHYLEAFAGHEENRRAVLEFLGAARKHQAGTEAIGRTWTRKELYDDRVRR